MNLEKRYWTVQVLSAEDGWWSWSNTFASIDAAERALNSFRRQNQEQPARILEHHDTAKIVLTDMR